MTQEGTNYSITSTDLSSASIGGITSGQYSTLFKKDLNSMYIVGNTLNYTQNMFVHSTLYIGYGINQLFLLYQAKLTTYYTVPQQTLKVVYSRILFQQKNRMNDTEVR